MNKYVTKYGMSLIIFGIGVLILTIVSLVDIWTVKNFIPTFITTFVHMIMLSITIFMIFYGVAHEEGD